MHSHKSSFNREYFGLENQWEMKKERKPKWLRWRISLRIGLQNLSVLVTNEKTTESCHK